jgi:hypothetical protein
MSKEKIKGKIMSVKEIMDESDYSIKYEIVVWFEVRPRLRLGECEIWQKDTK